MKEMGTGKVVICTGLAIDHEADLGDGAGVYKFNVHNPYGGAAYLEITTADRATSASLALAIKTAFPIGASSNLHSTLAAAITADASKVYLYGRDTAGDGTHVVESFNNPLPPDSLFTFTVTSGSYTLTAILRFA